MNKYVEDIAERLSLRDPQLYSLEILAWVADNISLAKDADVDAALRKISGRYSTVTDFERDFPSLCFALATGVGKTRLMGAAIAYLYAAKGMKNFFVLAPNLTIYNKLIADFTAGTPKYVFNGLAEFTVHTPQIITAENYENRGGLSAP
ncbi:MAG: DEAD/DEAH box helicase family protein, partial [Proteobacteria bacterium]|nr:DEAD/DEAH box helicase family protein [Pseudomonadota bacterium]